MEVNVISSHNNRQSDESLDKLGNYLGVILLKILEANFQVKFTGSSNDVLARLFNHALDHRVRLGQTLKTCENRKVKRNILRQ